MKHGNILNDGSRNGIHAPEMGFMPPEIINADYIP